MITIRPAREDGAEGMIELLLPIIQAGGLTIMDDASLESQLEFIRGFPERGVFHVAVCNASQTILGMQDVMPVSLNENEPPDMGEISTFVALGEQGKGIGRKLIWETFEAAKRKGFKKLVAAIRSDNPGALAFYRGLGFKVVESARKRALVGGEHMERILAEKPLDLSSKWSLRFLLIIRRSCHSED